MDSDHSDHSDHPNDPVDPALTAFLADHDVPCIRCGYNLRCLTTNRCPECGVPFVLFDGRLVFRTEAFTGAWASLAFGLILGAGVAASAAMGGKANGWPAVVWVAVGGVLTAFAVGLAILVLERRAFYRLSMAHQWRWFRAIVGLVLLAVLFLVFWLSRLW